MSGELRPRLCVIEKGPEGYGFHLHGEKNKTGQFIRLVETGSPASIAGLRPGDRLVFVNGDSVDGESHQQVVSRIKAVTGPLELIVVDAETQELLQKLDLKCKKEYVTSGIPMRSGESSDEEEEEEGKNGAAREERRVSETNGDIAAYTADLRLQESKNELRPRLCQMKKGATGYGFNLHSEKSKPGQYIRAVDKDSPAEKSGLLPHDKLVQVNGVTVLGMQHAEVVSTIKAGGDEVRLLVVDPDTDVYFASCQVVPSEKHLTGPLPEPVANRHVEEKVKEEAQEAKPKSSPSSSSSSSTSSIPAATPSSPPLEEKVLKKNLSGDASLDLNISLQQAKERAHQKRSNKRAPPMDWSKRSELFSNL